MALEIMRMGSSLGVLYVCSCPLIPAKAGIQSLRKNAMTPQRRHFAKRTRSPLPRGRSGRSARERLEHALRGHRIFAQSHAGGIEEGIGDGGPSRAHDLLA